LDDNLDAILQGGLRVRSISNETSYKFAMDSDPGSLEKRKLADLIVIERGHDPTKDIRDSQEIAMVMTNGRLFDAMTMAEIGEAESPAPKFFFQDPNQQTGATMPRVRGCDCCRPSGLPSWMIEK